MTPKLSASTNQFIEVHSPATLKKVGEVAVNSPFEVRAFVARSREAFRVWSALELKQRAKVLLSARDLFLQHQEELIQLICQENGKPRLEALIEITYVCDVITFTPNREDAS